ncbi:MAG: MarR family transcriptional regulator [Deltaproteobacteria bacterium]|nr:MarR family transcriptional regulator [Deltaproteobacteria bacterium]
MKTENEITINEIVGAIRRLVRAVYLDSAKMSKQFGLTGPQSAILRTLIITGPISSADLSRKLYVTPSNITGIIDRLEKKGLVERNRQDADRRIALLTLTESGMNLGKTLPDPIETKLISELADLEQGHVQMLSLAINQVLSLLDIKGIEETPLAWDQVSSQISNEKQTTSQNE